jgi:hypothetical protein
MDGAVVMHGSNVSGAFTAVGFGSGLPKVGGSYYIKDAHAFLFRVVKDGVVDGEPIKCKSKAGQGTGRAVCGGVGSAAMCCVVWCRLSRMCGCDVDHHHVFPLLLMHVCHCCCFLVLIVIVVVWLPDFVNYAHCQ